MSPAAPSQPVVIPTRTKKGLRQGSSHARAEEVGKDREKPHDPTALAPSVAALRAISTSRSRRKPSLQFSTEPWKSIGEAVDDATDNASAGMASSLSSPHSWRLLLSAPEDTGDDEGSTFGSDDAMAGSGSPLRSLSDESMPSLDTDNESAYASSSPSTPGIPIRNAQILERRSRSVSSSVPEESNSDHPLLSVHFKHECPPSVQSANNATVENNSSMPKRPSLRSNLTASLRRLRSAARTLSGSTASTSSSNEEQARPTIAQFSQFARERRPLPCAEPPDPALRRYLNPMTISPAEMYTHRDHEDCIAGTSSIQMQTYRPGARKSEKASAPPTFVLASSQGSPAHEPAVSTTPRHREPRENSDFLRVIVLEMNMRKVGKLSDVAPGRARLWLPARQVATQSEEKSNVIPKRWVSVDPESDFI
ncbi:MAG: hypothetical protein LQ346_007585 [Caloplaca aetnensis]|nr:MAG: hypothetical protein LQ346_007585 [Caloplaca aetnensis]